MDHDTTTDALLAEVDALVAASAEQYARLDALLAATAPRPVDTTADRLRRLHRTARHAARLTRLVERQQSALSTALDAMEA